MPNNLSKTKPVKKKLRVTPPILEAYAKRSRAFDADAQPLPPEKWAQSMTRDEFFRSRATKKQTTVRLDADVLAWLKSKGSGHISRVNAILRSAMLNDQKR
jgi:uncharacterized protein (DUF4415 family)